MKTCSKCKAEKELDRFPPAKRMADGRSSWCRDCHGNQQREWRKANPEKFKESLRSYYERNKERHHANTAAWKSANPDKVKATNAKYQQSLKDRVFAHYGETCSCERCPERSPGTAFLTIDHANGDGKEHRKTFTKNFYRWLIDEGFPEGFRTLCFNCNIARHWNGGQCPHMD